MTWLRDPARSALGKHGVTDMQSMGLFVDREVHKE